MTHMSVSWRALPTGHLVALSRTQELLVEMVPLVEDALFLRAELKRIRIEAARARQEAHELVLRSRRQRLGLRLVQRASGEPAETRSVASDIVPS